MYNLSTYQGLMYPQGRPVWPRLHLNFQVPYPYSNMGQQILPIIAEVAPLKPAFYFENDKSTITNERILKKASLQFTYFSWKPAFDFENDKSTITNERANIEHRREEVEDWEMVIKSRVQNSSSYANLWQNN